MSNAIIALLVSFLGGSSFSAILSYMAKRKEVSVNSNTQLIEQFNSTLRELFNRVDKLNKTVDELNSKLTDANRNLINERRLREEKEFENQQLKDKIDILNKQIDDLTKKVSRLNARLDQAKEINQNGST